MGNKTVLMINDKENDTFGVITPIDENTLEITWDEDNKETLSLEEFDVLMQNPDYEVTEETVEETAEVKEDTAAQDTIKTHKTANVKAGVEGDNNPKTRYDVMRGILGNLADVDMTTLVKYFNDQQALIGGEAARAGLDGNAAKNAATIQMKPSAAHENIEIKLDKENQDAIFGESTLTEEAKTKIATLFEAAVSAKVIDTVVKIQEDYDNKLKENIEAIKSDLVESLDIYLNRVASKWLEENEVAIESSLKIEMFDEFMGGLHKLMVENYINVPEEKIDVLEKVVGENEELNTKVNELLNDNISLEKTINDLKKTNILASMSEGFTLIQKEKFKKLTDSTEFVNEDTFKKNVEVIKENFIREKNTTSNILSEEVTTQEETITNTSKSNLDARVNRIKDVLSAF